MQLWLWRAEHSNVKTIILKSMVNVHKEYLVSYFKELSFVIFMLLLSGDTGVGMESIKIVLSYRYADSFLYPPIGKQYFFFSRNFFP